MLAPWSRSTVCSIYRKADLISSGLKGKSLSKSLTPHSHPMIQNHWVGNKRKPNFPSDTTKKKPNRLKGRR